MSNIIRTERYADAPDNDGVRPPEQDALHGDSSTPARAVQRSISTIQERLRLQDEELDNVRALIRSVNQNSQDRLTQLESGARKGGGEQLEVVVQSRMSGLEAALAKSVADSQTKTVEAVTEGVRNRMGPRISTLETQVVQQGQAITQMREVMSRTDANLERLVVEVDRLVTELAKRPERGIIASASLPSSTPERASQITAPSAEAVTGSYRTHAEHRSHEEEDDRPMFSEDAVARGRWKIPAAIFGMLLLLLLGGWFVARQFSRTSSNGSTSAANSREAGDLSPIEQARVFESQGDYPKAEAAYRELLKKNPNDAEVIRHLADVLFREDKIEESAQVLKRLTGGG